MLKNERDHEQDPSLKTVTPSLHQGLPMYSCTKLLNERKNEKNKGIADVLKNSVEETASIKDVPCRMSFFLSLFHLIFAPCASTPLITKPACLTFNLTLVSGDKFASDPH
ncbi:hypothetical protein TNCT_463491 [Trichonephila clavata]|uniref:Uncharacterized protein n=1 Tax=Trichonephila clavata TaxID=2740835 RepID=A0A8X6LCG1_TRICU|nr:hypothetical protein TNCT_463491 [Trichonephila clavata]